MAKPPVSENLTTLSVHLAVRKPSVAPELASVIEAIALAGKSIARKVRRARIEDVLGQVGHTNVQGEAQEKLDVLSKDLMLHCLSECPAVGVCASEEEDEAVVVRPRSDGGAYAVLFDPLDGSSNINVAVGVGTIFSILPNDLPDERTAEAVLENGVEHG